MAQLLMLRDAVPRLLELVAQSGDGGGDTTPPLKKVKKTERAPRKVGPHAHHKVEVVSLMGSGEKAAMCVDALGIAAMSIFFF